MARLSGIDLPKNKKIVIALTYIHGIGLNLANDILNVLRIECDTKVNKLSEDDIIKLRNELRNYIIEGDLKRQTSQNVKRLMDINSYRGIRHKRRLPSRGQRTHTNARTKRGKRIAVAGKKKVTK